MVERCPDGNREGILLAGSDDRGPDRAAAPGDARVMDDLPLLERRDVSGILGWVSVPDSTTPSGVDCYGRERPRSRFCARYRGRWLAALGARWWGSDEAADGAPELGGRGALRAQAGRRGAGYSVNLNKHGCSSYHLVAALVRETGDCLRVGGSHTAEAAAERIGDLAGGLKGAGVEDRTVRLDKDFFAGRCCERWRTSGVSLLLKVPRHHRSAGHRGSWRYLGHSATARQPRSKVNVLALPTGSCMRMRLGLLAPARSTTYSQHLSRCLLAHSN